ncbi:unnamed protein product [Protopolystoma xenopodis]|uniref:Histone deacetylase interacting domain-containing protein n=1 Tax=Protopolystoma xenopodis TaxID=117903 RepID=A0A3S4ZYN1_9PLAT|nr:unnamed protein product [Protopolystoma xenopodis]
MRLRVEDALAYLDQVKARFASQGDIYTDFLDVMREFKAQTIGTEAVIRRVRELFRGHDDLISGFNTFIPQGLRGGSAGSQRIVQSPVYQPPPPCISPAPPCDPSTRSLTSSGRSSDPCDQATISVHQLAQPSVLPTVPGLRTPNHLFTSHIGVAPPAGPRVQTPTTKIETFIHNQQSGPFLDAQHGSSLRELYPSHNITTLGFNSQNRFQGNPEVYQQFLDILHWYQREQKNTDATHRKLAENTVYQDVAKLFDGQEDLLEEFHQFLPESSPLPNCTVETPSKKSTSLVEHMSLTSSGPRGHPESRIRDVGAVTPYSTPSSSIPAVSPPPNQPPAQESKKIKRLASNSISPNVPVLAKKSRHYRDVSLVDSAQHGSAHDMALISKIRDALDADASSGNRIYNAFLQNIYLFNKGQLAKEQLLESTKPFFSRHTELWRSFRDLINVSLYYYLN